MLIRMPVQFEVTVPLATAAKRGISVANEIEEI
jgi:hypothetical protein